MRRNKWFATGALGVGLGVALAAAWFGIAAPRVAEAWAATGYMAKTVCSCLYVERRGLAGCKADALMDHEPFAGVGLSVDENDKSVTARLFLLMSARADYEEGFGCTLR